ncbi:YheC/YheD family protein [Heliobacterium chlorum]|uniref:YheC/YheD family protein n=1 Tax=Heliobacterium chlorum TaxID=2698 RepID=A0ABR7T761_HELCL|nr:YheC/YheD family protein [Heliobacterium chlorum]MBC9786466.1 YheC/YheD family protein [Heliobacterium chlorum]
MARIKKGHRLVGIGKWRLWKYFAKNIKIRPHLPDTRLLSENTFQSFLYKYESIFIKPWDGYGGEGIYKVWRKNQNYLIVKERGEPETYSDVGQLYSSLKSNIGNKRQYIIQQAVDLALIEERPFDIRIMFLRYKGDWKYAGMVAKVAGKDSIITNIKRGKGYTVNVDEALRKSFNWDINKIKDAKKKMVSLGYRTCYHFDRYKRYSRMGLDIALDKEGRLWMFDQNTVPALFLFKKNKTTYKKIQAILRNQKNNKMKKSSFPQLT